MTTTNADMSYTKSLKFKIYILIEAIKRDGFIQTLKSLLNRFLYHIKGVDFFSAESLESCVLAGENKRCGTAYVAINQNVFNYIFNRLQDIDKDITNGCFTDFGSGKGYALFLAQKFGFKKVTGVEFAKELYNISLYNLEKLKLQNIKIYYQDAADFPISKKTRVIYLFNPFNETVMKKVSENILSMRDDFENTVYIVYINPSCEYIFEKLPYRLIFQEHIQKEDFKVKIYSLTKKKK